MNYSMPDSKTYATALSAIEPKIPERYKEMLRIHYHAPKHRLTASEMAKAIGYHNFNAVNLHYGRLARILMDKLGISEPRDLYLEILVDFPKLEKQESKELVWALLPQVVVALEELNWT